MIALRASPQAAHLSPERLDWLCEKVEAYRLVLIAEGVEPEVARQRAYTRGISNCGEPPRDPD